MCMQGVNQMFPPLLEHSEAVCALGNLTVCYLFPPPLPHTHTPFLFKPSLSFMIVELVCTLSKAMPIMDIALRVMETVSMERYGSLGPQKMAKSHMIEEL